MNSATAAHADSGGILDILLSYWWLAALSWWFSAFFGGSILEWITESFGVGLAALRRSVWDRHERKLELNERELQLKRLELLIAQASAAGVAVAAPAPGLCRHRKALPVRSGDGDVVAWLCQSCDTQLPPEFSIYAEDL